MQHRLTGSSSLTRARRRQNEGLFDISSMLIVGGRRDVASRVVLAVRVPSAGSSWDDGGGCRGMIGGLELSAVGRFLAGSINLSRG